MGELNFIKPVNHKAGDNYGSRGGTHHGIDYEAPMGTSVKASEGGKVVRAADNPKTAKRRKAYGNVIVIDHTPYADKKDRHIYTLYAHLDSMSVKYDANVILGEVIGKSGNTGQSTGPHLHFEVIDSGYEMNWAKGKVNDGAMGPTGALNRLDPECYFGYPTIVEGTLSQRKEDVVKKISEILEYKPYLDLKRGIFRIDVELLGKKIVSIDEHSKEFRLSLTHEEQEEILKASIPQSKNESIMLNYDIKIQ